MSAPDTALPKESGRGVLLAFLLEPCCWVVFFVLLSIASTRAVAWMLGIFAVLLLGGALIYVGHEEARAEASKPDPEGNPMS